MADEPAMFNMLAEKVMHQAINPAYLAYCPTMDLIALATIDEQVQVYRLNGQRVFGVTNKQSESKIRGLKWKPNGQNLLPIRRSSFWRNELNIFRPITCSRLRQWLGILSECPHWESCAPDSTFDKSQTRDMLLGLGDEFDSR